MLPPPPKNDKISSAFSYNFISALTAEKDKDEAYGYLKKAQEDMKELPGLLEQAREEAKRLEKEIGLREPSTTSPKQMIGGVIIWAIIIFLIFKACGG